MSTMMNETTKTLNEDEMDSTNVESTSSSEKTSVKMVQVVQ